jgi:hypothetical protein
MGNLPLALQLDTAIELSLMPTDIAVLWVEDRT